MITIGKHHLTTGCITSPDVDAMIAGKRVSVLYTDPPWGEGNMKFWVSLADKQGHRIQAQTTYANLLARIRVLSRYVDGHVFVETGCTWCDDVLAAMSGLHHVKAHEMRYKSGAAPCILVEGTTAPHYKPLQFDPSPYRGATLPKMVVAAVGQPGRYVLDPCCGMGYTAKAAVAAGMGFLGNEINPARLEKTIDFLRRKG